MASDLPLARLQRWMQAVVVHPGTTEEALMASSASAELPPGNLPDVILPSRTLSPSERLAVYQSMYPLRMNEALESDYPGLAHFLGPEAFHALVVAYVQAFPSRHHSLNRLGDHLPEYVSGAHGVTRRAFCHDLARLERAVNQVFDADETPPLSEAAIAAVAPEAWPDARLTTVAPFRLLSFRYPVNAYLESMRGEEHDHPKPRLKESWVVVYRRGLG